MNQHANNNNGVTANGNVNGVAMSETSDDSSLNSVDLDPMGESDINRIYDSNSLLTKHFFLPTDAGATYVDSDTGLESMSSAEATTKACSLCLDGPPNLMAAGPEVLQQLEGLRQEVTRLKCDKLDLLRQNVVCIDSPNPVLEHLNLILSISADMSKRYQTTTRTRVIPTRRFSCGWQGDSSTERSFERVRATERYEWTTFYLTTLKGCFRII